MANVLAKGLWSDPKALGGKSFTISCYFTTDGSGVPTMGTGTDLNGLISVAQGTDSGETNYYTITFPGSWGITRAVKVDHGTARTYTKVVDASAGTVEIQFSDTMFSGRIDVELTGTATSLG